MKGRTPQPTALKILKGRAPGRDSGGRPLNANEPKPTPTAPACPTWCSNEAKAEWRRVVPELDRIGMLTKVDRGALAAYCEAWSVLKAATAEIKAHGVVLLIEEYELPDGRTLMCRAGRNPAVAIAKDASAVIRAFCTEFGLTPSSRGRMTLPRADDDDLDAVLARRRAERARSSGPSA